MTSPVKLIRQGVAGVLAGLTTAPGGVFPQRTIPYLERKLTEDGACVAIYSASETADDEDTSPRVYARDLVLAVEIIAADSKATPGEDVVDDISEEVEALLEAAAHLQGRQTVDGNGDPVVVLARHTKYRGFEIAVDTETQLTIYAKRLFYSVDYRTEAAAPVLGDFTTAHAGWDLAEPKDDRGEIGPAGPIDAEDTFTVQQ